jgi:5-(carboxyamino)imidazole ribonucleotide mutase
MSDFMERPPKVAVIIGSKSDKQVMDAAGAVLEEFGIKFEQFVSSAHRMPNKTRELALALEKNGFSVIIAGAGKAAHLPGVLASYTVLPVIGVPIKTDDLQGLDSLLSIVQMPAGVPVATVAINGAKNAALLAVQILGLKFDGVMTKYRIYKSGLESDA